MTATPSARPVLVVEHEADCPPGWVGEWLAAAGREMDLRRPHADDVLPERLDQHAGMIVLGGSMDAYSEDRHPWLGAVKELVRLAAQDHVPVLGICLGHQLAAVALGGAVQRNPRGQQIGVVPMGWAPEATEDPLLGAVTDARAAVQWNNDIVVVLPPDGRRLAATPAGEIQAARFAPTVWGVQCHPEAGVEIVSAWAESDRDHALERGVDLDGHLAEIADAEDELRAAWEPLARRFVELAARGEETAGDRASVTAW